MANNILKEAIADAKAVREVALANAKAALEEAFTPKLQSMLSNKLSSTLEESEEEEDVDLDEMLDLDEKEDIEEEMSMDDEGEDLDEEIDLEDILNELELGDEDSEEEEIDQMASMLTTEDDEESINEGACKSCNENKDFDLDKLLEDINNLNEEDPDMAEIDNYLEGKGQTDETWKIFRKWANHDHPHQTSHKNPRTLEGEEEDLVHNKPAAMKAFAGVKGDEEMMNEGPEIFTAMAGLAGVIGSAGILTAIELAMEDPSFKEKHPKAYDALTKIFGFFKKIGGDVGKGIKEGSLKNYVKDMAYDELKESRRAYNKIKSELNEVNLLNSKLLYVNRIFKANNLSEAQKLRVVETLDNASNVKEAKLIYETIKDTFTISKGKKTTPKKPIRENFGMASKAAGISTAPKKPILNESNDMVTRMQKLANIKINQ